MLCRYDTLVIVPECSKINIKFVYVDYASDAFFWNNLDCAIIHALHDLYD